MKNKLFYILIAILFSLAINNIYIRLADNQSLKEVFFTNADEANNLTAELMVIKKDILKNDPFFPWAMYSKKIPFCYRAFWFVIGSLGKILNNLELANAIITFIFSLIFIAGLCILCWYLSGSPSIGILVAAFSSIPMEATGGVIYGLRYLLRPAILSDLFIYTSPWLLLFFFKTVRDFKKFILFLLLLILLTNFYLLGASLLLLVTLVTFLIIEISSYHKKTMSRLWSLLLFISIVLLLIFLVAINFGKEYGISAQHIPTEWLKFRFAHLVFDKSLIIDKITFWSMPIVFAIFGYCLKRTNKEHWKDDKQLLAFFFAALGITLFGMIANYNKFFIRFFIDRTSVYLYIILFLYSAYCVFYLYKKKTFTSIALSFAIFSLLIIPKGKVLVPFLRSVEEIIIPAKRISHAKEKELKRNKILKRQSLIIPFMEMAEWVKNNTLVDDIFMIPPDEFPAFRYYAQRPIVVDRKSGSAILLSNDLANLWTEAYTKVKDVYNNPAESKIINITSHFNAKYIVMYTNTHNFNLPIAFQNKYFIVYKINSSGGVKQDI